MQENGVQRGKILRKCRKWRSMQRKGKQKHEKKQESRKYYCIKNMGKNRPSPCRKTTNRRTPPREIESVELEKACAGFRSKLSQVYICTAHTHVSICLTLAHFMLSFVLQTNSIYISCFSVYFYLCLYLHLYLYPYTFSYSYLLFFTHIILSYFLELNPI